MNAIKQKKGFESRAYTLTPESDFIEVEFNTIKDKYRYKVHLTEVGNEILYQADNLLVGKIFMAFTTLVAISSAAYYFLANPEEPGFYIVCAIVFGVISIFGIFVPNVDDLVITNGSKTITLFRNKPNEEKVVEFANLLIARANDKKKEMMINFDLNEDQFNTNINWLHMMKMIDKTELAQLQEDFNLKKLI
ncbi:MAG: hypothetical protein ACQEWG_15300 [Bacteroidota bacterium]